MSGPAVVITSINPPSDAVSHWASALPLVVVADQKTPEHAYAGLPLTLLPFAGDHRLQLSPANHYSRKNLGYLEAIARGHDLIVDTDDDTWPQLAADTFNLAAAERSLVRCATSDFVNVFALRLPGERIWPRGFPLDELDAVAEEVTHPEAALVAGEVAIVQLLIDGDTDVDAIHRLVFGAREVRFTRVGRLQVLPAGSFCPFNTQLTVVARAAFPLLYLPTHVSFRFTDILRGVVAKRALDASGLRFAFGDPAGFQVRNPHSYFADFVAEVDVYLQVRTAWECLDGLAHAPLPALLRDAYQRLEAAGVVPGDELALVDEWLHALAALGA